jgi:hypothetical protein
MGAMVDLGNWGLITLARITYLSLSRMGLACLLREAGVITPCFKGVPCTV